MIQSTYMQRLETDNNNTIKCKNKIQYLGKFKVKYYKNICIKNKKQIKA